VTTINVGDAVTVLPNAKLMNSNWVSEMDFVVGRVGIVVEADLTLRIALIQFLGDPTFYPITFEPTFRAISRPRVTFDYFLNGPSWWLSFDCLGAATLPMTFLPLLMKIKHNISYPKVISSAIQVII
jgi:hypothetical protein